MMKQLLMKNIFYLPVVLVISLSLLGGCAYVEKAKKWNETPPIMDVPQKKLHQIDVMELKEIQKEVPVEVETVEPELSETNLSIEECRALAFENNLDLRVQRFDPTLSRERLNQEEARFESTFSVDTSYMKSSKLSANSVDGSNSDSVYMSMGVDMPLRTGGSLSFNLTDNFQKSDSAFYQSSSYTASLSASISHPLLKGAGKKARTHSIRIAQYDSKLSDVQMKLNATGIIANVDSAYWLLYARRKILDVRKQQYDYSKAFYEQTERFVEVGVRPRIELVRTKSTMAQRWEGIIRAENSVRETERSLKRMLNKKGLGMETKTIIIPSTLPNPIYYEIDRKEMVKNALKNRMELLDLELRLARDMDDIEYYKNRALPDVNFTYTYSPNGLGLERGDAYDILIDNNNKSHRALISLKVPLGNKVAKSQLRSARLSRARRLITKESKEAEIKNDVLNQIDTLEASWQRILASRLSTVLADEQYRAEKRQFELGLVTSTDVLDSQTKLTDAQVTEIVAIIDYQRALISLAKATGTLLGASKVELDTIMPMN